MRRYQDRLNEASRARREGVTVSGGADLVECIIRGPDGMGQLFRWSLAFFIGEVIQGGLNELGKDLFERVIEIVLTASALSPSPQCPRA